MSASLERALVIAEPKVAEALREDYEAYCTMRSVGNYPLAVPVVCQFDVCLVCD